MLRKITHTAISMLAMAIICVSAVDARGRQSAPRRPNGVRNLDGPPRLGQGGHPERGLAQLDLTEEQQPAIRERVEELKETGASREEIHAAVAEMLEGFGVEVPERRIGRVGHILEQLDLTDEQRQTVRDTIAEMKEAGATPEEIRPAVIELLEGFGVEIPENLGEGPGPGLHRRPGPGRGLSQLDLTDEQRQAVRDRIAEMKEAEATREEVHAAVVELLEGFGVEIPENLGQGPGPGKHRRPGPGRGLSQLDLTDEQRETIRGQVEEMREAGASRQEIRTAVAELLEEFGVEAPDNPFIGGTRGRGHGRSGGHIRGFFLENLTDEQRTEIRATVAEMKETGATPEEIHAAVAELLEGYGVTVGSQGDGDGETDDAAADLAIIDAEIAAAPGVSPTIQQKITTWGQLKTAQ